MAIIEHILKLKDQASPTLAQVAGNAKSADERLGGVIKGLGLASAGALLAGAGFAVFAKQLHDSRNEAQQLARQTGASVQEIRAIQLAAEASGQKVEDWDKAVRQMRDHPDLFKAINDQARMFGADYGPDAVEATRQWNAATSELKTLVMGLGEQLVTAVGGDAIGNFTAGLVAASTALVGFFESIFGSIRDGITLAISHSLQQIGLMAQAFEAIRQGDIAGALAISALSQNATRSSAVTGAGLAAGAFPDATAAAGAAGLGAVGQLFANRKAIADAGGLGGVNFGGSPEHKNRSGDVVIDMSDVQTWEEIMEDERRPWLVAFSNIAAMQRVTAQTLNQIGTLVGVGGSVVGGDIGGAVSGLGSLLGPTGAAAGQIAGQVIGVLQQLGTEGAAAVGAKLEENARAIVAGIKEIPKLLGEVLPDLIADVLPELITELVKALPALIVAQYQVIGALIASTLQMLFSTLPEMLAQAMVEGFFQIWDAIRGFFEGLFTVDKGERNRAAGKAARVGLAIGTLGLSELALAGGRGVDNALEKRGGKGLPFFWGGGRMPWDGLAFLHAGERVVPSDGAGSGTTSRGMGGGGGGAVFNFNGPVVDHRGLIDLINRTLGTRGANKGIG
jgi:hypothetical protein